MNDWYDKGEGSEHMKKRHECSLVKEEMVMIKEKTNLYGYWQYDEVIGLGSGIVKYDLVYVFKIENDMAHAVDEKGIEISFHKSFIPKEYFCRPSYKSHKTCELGESSSKSYKKQGWYELHKNDCHRCQMYKFKDTVKRYKDRQELQHLKLVACCSNCEWRNDYEHDPPECVNDEQKAKQTRPDHICGHHGFSEFL